MFDSSLKSTFSQPQTTTSHNQLKLEGFTRDMCWYKIFRNATQETSGNSHLQNSVSQALH